MRHSLDQRQTIGHVVPKNAVAIGLSRHFKNLRA
jgi:hypothetical protein